MDLTFGLPSALVARCALTLALGCGTSSRADDPSRFPGYPGLPRPMDHAACAQDELLERVVGAAPGEACPASPAALASPMASGLYYFDHVVGDAEARAAKGYPGFVLEHDAGAAAGAARCVYLGCVATRVGSTGSSPKGSETCVGPFTGGTSVPSLTAPGCPRALQVAGELRALARADGGLCCYPWPGPVPP